MKKLIITVLLTLLANSVIAQSWDQLIKLTPNEREADDRFGISVAIDGNYAMVGAYKESEDENGGNTKSEAGSVYIFKNNSGIWTQVQKIVADDRSIGDHFGFGITIDGDYAIIGAPDEDDDENGNNYLYSAGSAYIFKNNAGTWSQVQKIVPNERAEYDAFGGIVAISGDYAIFGLSNDGEDENGNNTLDEAGSAFIFKNNSGTWSQVQKIVAGDRDTGDRFGASVAMEGDYAIIGAYLEYEDENGNNPLKWAGSAYIFKNNSGTWSQHQKIVAADRDARDRFGNSVAISGNYAIIGAYQDDKDENGSNILLSAGSAYIFKNNSGTWAQYQKIAASDREISDYFGYSVSISGDYAIVGANWEDEDENGNNTLSFAGSAYIFKNNSGTWSQLQKIAASDRKSYDYFGVSVAISGNFAIVGADSEDEDGRGSNTLSRAGSAYLFGDPTSDPNLPGGSGTSIDPYLITSKDELHWLTYNLDDWGKHYKQTMDITLSTSDFQSGGIFYNNAKGYAPIGSNGKIFTGSYDGDGHKVSNVEINRGSTDNVGFFGYLANGGEVKNVGVENIDLTGADYAGGLVGNNSDGGVVTNCYATGSVSGVSHVGGLVGNNQNTIDSSYATATVNGSGDRVGGLVGYNTTGGNISESYSTGSTSGNENVGGLVGINDSGTVINSYATGAVSGNNYIAGLVGVNYDEITNCFSTGLVSGSSSELYGLIASDNASSVVTNSFWDTETSNQTTSIDGTGKITSEMKTASTFTNAGWDDSIWNIGDGINEGYPYLKWQNTDGTPLPVELTSFTAKLQDENSVFLKWETATEVNNYGFQVQRKKIKDKSEDEWETLGFVQGNGTTNSPKNYEFTDPLNLTLNPNLNRISYRLKQIDNDGTFAYSKLVTVDLTTITSVDDAIEYEFALEQNYPNPFNPTTTIKFTLPSPSQGKGPGVRSARLVVYDILGREVATLVKQKLQPGNHKVEFNASRLSSGMYFYHIDVGNEFNSTKKMLLIK